MRKFSQRLGEKPTEYKEVCSVDDARASEFGHKVRSLFKGYRVVDVLVYDENVGTDSERTGVQFILEDGRRVDVYLDCQDEVEESIQEHE